MDQDNIRPEKRSRNRLGWAYIVGPGIGEPFKIGHTNFLATRMRDLQQGNHRRLIVHAALQSPMMYTAEGRLAVRFQDHHILGEWYHWNEALDVLLSRLRSGCAETFRSLCGDGHLQVGDKFFNHTAAVERL